VTRCPCDHTLAGGKMLTYSSGQRKPGAFVAAAERKHNASALGPADIAKSPSC
jgi:hypothetical protein